MTVEPSEAQIGVWIAKACKENPDGSMLKIARSVAQSAYASALNQGQNAHFHQSPLRNLRKMANQKKVDLSQQVSVTLRNGDSFNGTVEPHDNLYRIDCVSRQYWPYRYLYSREGIYADVDPSGWDGNLNIAMIGRVEPVQTTEGEPKCRAESGVKLKNETMVRIADAISPEVVQYVEAHMEYPEFMYKLFEEFMDQKLGRIDPTIVGELSCLLMDRIYLKSSKLDT